MAGFLPTRISPTGDDSSTLEIPQQFNPAAGPPNTLEIPQQFARRPAPRMAPPYAPQPPNQFSSLPWRQGGVFGTLSQIESGQHNILSQIDEGSPEERSQGFFQIKTSTLRRYGAQMGIDPSMLTRAMDLPPEMQMRIASQIPLREFGPRTQALMRQKYGALDGRMTIGQIANMFGEGTAYAAEPPPDAAAARGLPRQGEPQARLQQILAGQGPETRYGPLGMQPLEADIAGEGYNPRDVRAMEPFGLGFTGDIEAAKEISQLPGAARAMVRRARQFGVDPEDIGPLAQRVREGTLTVRGLSQALKNLRGDVPETARTAAAIRGAYGRTDLPRDLLGEISKAVRAGHLSLQQAKQMLKVGGPAAVVGLTAGKAYGAEDGTLPPPPGDLPGGGGVAATVPGATYLAGTPPAPQAQGPVNMAKLRANIAHLPADRQQRILTKARGINQDLAQSSTDPVVKQQLARYGEVYRTGPGNTGAIPADRREDIEEDIRHPWYGHLRRPGTAATGYLSGALIPKGAPAPGGGYYGYSPEQRRELRSWAGHTFFPQTPTQAALLAATAPIGWGETAPELAPEVEAGLKGLGRARQIARAVSATPLRRLGVMGAVGGTTSAATGDRFWPGVGTGLAFQAPGEILSAVGGTLGRVGLANRLLRQTEADVSREIARNLPGDRQGKPYNLQKLKTPGKLVEDVNAALRPQREAIYRQLKNKRWNFPVIVSGDPKEELAANPARWKLKPMLLQQIEEQLSHLQRLSYAPKDAEPKVTQRAAQYRAIADRYRSGIARVIGPLKDDWLAVRDKLGRAFAIERLMKDFKVIDPKKGTLDQPKLVQGILEHWDDLRRQLGRDATERLWRAATRLNPRGFWYRGSPMKGAYEDRPAHLIPRFYLHGKPAVSIHPETYKPVGNVPIWMYPPTAPVTALTGPYAVHGEQSLRPPPQQSDQEGQ